MLRLMAFAVALALVSNLPSHEPQQERAWRSTFHVERGALGPSGSNAYFTLQPGSVSVLEGGDERLVITVLDEIRVVDGVTTRIVEERETKAGRLVEVSRNFFALDAATHDVYYFGEEVDLYKDGHVSGHEGAWLSGVQGARFGLMMPSAPVLHDRFYQEVAVGLAMDRVEIVDLDARVTTPAGTFAGCLKVEETTPLEPGATEYKYYARSTGLVQDGSLRLVRFSPAR